MFLNDVYGTRASLCILDPWFDAYYILRGNAVGVRIQQDIVVLSFVGCLYRGYFAVFRPCLCGRGGGGG